MHASAHHPITRDYIDKGLTMQRPNPSKNSRSFLEKFQGKKNAISRQGLLHLLQAKRPSVDNDALRDKQKAILLREPRLDPLAPTKQPKETRAKSNGKDPAGGQQGQGLFMANDLQQRYARMREELRQPRSVQLINGSKVRLPAINKGNSHSHSTHLHKKNAETAPAEHSEEIGTQRLRSMPRKAEGGGNANTEGLVLNNLGKKIELDKYALRHLQFLDKFEKQLLQSDSVAKKTSRSEYH